MKILAVIPARFASTRFPGKPLINIYGKPMVQRVYEQVSKTHGITKVVVATDHTKIYECVKQFGGNVCMTSPEHQNGTSRCGEVIKKEVESFDFLINVQGDEPFIDPTQIETLTGCFDQNTQIATLCKKIVDIQALNNSNIVKVVKSHKDMALYFSRSAIPFVRDYDASKWMTKTTFFKHIGIYGFRTDIVPQLVDLEVGMLENAESLEQLRWLENGYSIKLAETQLETIGIDTPEDLIKAELFISEQNKHG